MLYKSIQLFFFGIFLLLPVLIFGQTTANTNSFTSEVLFQEAIYFDFGKDDLRPEDIQKLEDIIAALEDNEFVKIRITAHTDSIGSTKNNQLLSERRGASVKTFLITKGIPDSLLEVGLFGEHAPIAENHTESGRQQNRRATIELVKYKLDPPPVVPRNKPPMGLVEGTVVDKTTGTPIQATVIIRSKTFRDSVATDSTGYFSKEVPINTVVGIDVFAPGYFFETKMMKVASKLQSAPTLSFELPPATAGEIAAIRDLFFVGGKAILLPKSKPILPKVLRFMQVNSKLTIEIAGHINLPYRKGAYFATPSKWEQELSENRAKLVYDFLIKNNINPNRISWKGYGNSEMKFPFATKEVEMSQNRRVEIRVVE
jgi:Outer membrane protein and related peptidoglycan-associated (lipo)proteins